MICPRCNGTGQVPDAPATETGIKELAAVARPEVGQSFIDQTFGTEIRRITHAEEGRWFSTEYPTVSPWNSDGSLLLLVNVDHFTIHDGRDGKIVEGEGYHEFEVMDESPSSTSPKQDDPDQRSFYLLKAGLRVVE